ncbi:MAG TPA: hypothetical protein DDW42_05700 [Desulfobacteraceae bacterium]|nr:hypothetical protein [Desulfobacteraceae bacterium]
MIYPNKVVIHLLDGNTIKGTAQSPSLSDEIITVHTVDNEFKKIKADKVKAVYFVKDWEGNPEYSEKTTVPSEKETYSNVIQLEFKDGEIIEARIQYLPPTKGFYIIPPDANSNNKRIYVRRSALKEIKIIP